MAAATQSAPAPATNGATQQTDFVSRVASIPVVNDTLTYGHSVIQKNSYSAAAYDKGAEVASQLYKATEPISSRLQPQIKAVDGLANRSLDYVQAKVPYLFEASGDELVASATKPANDAAAAARARLNPLAEQFSQQLQQASTSLHSVQDRVAHAVASLPRSPQDAQQAASAAASSLLAEVERIRDMLATKGKELPEQLKAVVANVVDHLQKGANEIRAELARGDATASAKAQSVLAITRDHATPVIQDAIASVRGIVSASADKATEVKDTTAAKVDEAGAKVNGAAH